MATTKMKVILIDDSTRGRLKKRKIYQRQTYDEVINQLLDAEKNWLKG